MLAGACAHAAAARHQTGHFYGLGPAGSRLMRRFFVAFAGLAGLLVSLAPGAVPAAGLTNREILMHCSGCDMAGMDLHGQNLSGIRFEGTNLRGANLQGANLRNAIFEGTNLDNSDMRRADLRNARFEGTSLRGTHFDGAQLDGAMFEGVNLSDGVLSGLSDGAARSMLNRCEGCNLANVSLAGHDLHGVRLEGANMRGMDLHGANLDGAQLEGVNLDGAHLQSANFHSAELLGSNLRNSDARNANFQNAVVCSDDTTTINDHGARSVIVGKTDCVELGGTDLHGANFTGARHCVWLGDGTQPRCKPATAQMLQQYGHANLSGAIGL
jgi:uncharacterized protein YjbI with pentapeptide repeats